ncbi:CNP1-like family protein [Thiogranum longum]|uniref:CNP1-like family protein n=1 Tax=Thiogranum longum TaxID=1537524 RepID=A0A4R1HB74_9GAMM|nr:CNP1-like family protein [Thiogranum longum]TCK17455.1 CNP1-like family protein [Thiogranum longum]
MIKNIGYAGVLVLGCVVLSVTAAGEDPVFGDLYGEEGSAGFVEGKAWEEQGLVLPAYPDVESRDLIEVDLLLKNYPFRLLIDPASVSVGKDGVVRYTAIIKSRSGATNVIYEGIRCSRGQYRRYAFGGQAGFQLAMNSRWRYIRGGERGAEAYLKVLYDHFICPSPAPGKPGPVLRRLRAPNPDNFFYGEEE